MNKRGHRREIKNMNGELCATCSVCERWLPFSSFYASGKVSIKHKIRSRCKECEKNLRELLKREVMEVYCKGSIHCQCPGCNVQDIEFLTIDHINNDGVAHRTALGYTSKNKWIGNAMYRLLKKEGFPIGLQVLCYNCNCGKEHNGGICPHMNEQVSV